MLCLLVVIHVFFSRSVPVPWTDGAAIQSRISSAAESTMHIQRSTSCIAQTPPSQRHQAHDSHACTQAQRSDFKDFVVLYISCRKRPVCPVVLVRPVSGHQLLHYACFVQALLLVILCLVLNSSFLATISFQRNVRQATSRTLHTKSCEVRPGIPPLLSHSSQSSRTVGFGCFGLLVSRLDQPCLFSRLLVFCS